MKTGKIQLFVQYVYDVFDIRNYITALYGEKIISTCRDQLGYILRFHIDCVAVVVVFVPVTKAS